MKLRPPRYTRTYPLVPYTTLFLAVDQQERRTEGDLMNFNQPPKYPDRRTPIRMMQTFQVVAPKSTHTYKATCEDVECGAYLRGWRMTIDLNTDQIGRAHV